MSTPAHGATCRTCGAPLEPGAVFCADCGARVAGAPEPFAPVRSGAPTPVAAAPVGLAPTPPPGESRPVPRRAVAAPSTAYPVAPGSVASIGSRALAFAIDGLVLLVAYGIGYGVVAATGNLPGSVADPGATRVALLLPGLLGLLVGIGQWVAEATTGATVGNAVVGIRTVSSRTGRPAGLLAILVRQLVVAVGFLVCLVGEWIVVVSGAWDSSPAQRGWHDKAAGTLVLRAGRVARAPVAAPSTAWSAAVARTMGDPVAGEPGVVPDPPAGPVVAAEPPVAPVLVTGAPGVPPAA
ncbi:RDD family protein, partial [Cellulomonas sp. ICMP 17802]|uniref:RDD family protein n=1 Tax=Cellulomonas sp. ICMP 17802 TaxID=3239199 RepID=UPI00351AF0FA